MTITSDYVFDHEAGLMIRKDTQDVEDILKANHEARMSGENTDRKSNMRRIASIPLVVVTALKTRSMEDGGPIDLNLIGVDPDHAARFTRFLNDSANYKLRTSDAWV